MTNPQDDPQEVARAREHRSALERRRVATEARLRALAGSRTARRELAQKFEPVVGAAEDRRESRG